jgi:hypothetical protein
MTPNKKPAARIMIPSKDKPKTNIAIGTTRS